MSGCVSDNTDDGVAIPLDNHTGCTSVTDHPPYATVYGSYNVATEAKTPEGLHDCIAAVRRCGAQCCRGAGHLEVAPPQAAA
jgi:hypothetical protein